MKTDNGKLEEDVKECFTKIQTKGSIGLKVIKLHKVRCGTHRLAANHM